MEFQLGSDNSDGSLTGRFAYQTGCFFFLRLVILLIRSLLALRVLVTLLIGSPFDFRVWSLCLSDRKLKLLSNLFILLIRTFFTSNRTKLF